MDNQENMTTTITIFVEPFVHSIFLDPSLIGDMHVALGCELVLLYEGMLHSMDDGPVGHLVAGRCHPHDHSHK